MTVRTRGKLFRGKVHFHVVVPPNKWETYDEFVGNAESIAMLLTVAEGFRMYEGLMGIFEETLTNCWQSFCLLGDVNVEFFDLGICIHTRHDRDAAHQMAIMLNPGGFGAAVAQIDGFAESLAIHEGVDWNEWVQFLGGMRTNQIGIVRSLAPRPG